MDKYHKIILFHANLKPVSINYKIELVPDMCECGEFRIFQKDNKKWRCAKCGKEVS